jgi:hypothetical protein
MLHSPVRASARSSAVCILPSFTNGIERRSRLPSNYQTQSSPRGLLFRWHTTRPVPPPALETLSLSNRNWSLRRAGPRRLADDVLDQLPRLESKFRDRMSHIIHTFLSGFAISPEQALSTLGYNRACSASPVTLFLAPPPYSMPLPPPPRGLGLSGCAKIIVSTAIVQYCTCTCVYLLFLGIFEL